MGAGSVPTTDDLATPRLELRIQSAGIGTSSAGSIKAPPKVATSAYPLIVPPLRAVSVLDSSGAADAFNAGYLKARMDGMEPAEAALREHELAGWIIGRAGAIPARDASVRQPQVCRTCPGYTPAG